MNIKNKTIIFLGSSVTYGDSNYSMCEAISEATGANVIKWAVSGTTLSTAKPNSYVERMLNVIDTRDKCDFFVTQLSTNDAAHNIDPGTVSDSFDKADFDTTTVAGAIEFIIAAAREKWNCPIAFYTGTFYNSQKYRKMVDILLEAAKKWNIGVIDLWNNEEMHKVSDEDRKRYMKDDVHPTKNGYIEWWLPVFTDYFKNYNG